MRRYQSRREARGTSQVNTARTRGSGTRTYRLLLIVLVRLLLLLVRLPLLLVRGRHLLLQKVP
jgi:hypothetical protein